MKIIDSHCHPQFPQYDEDRDEVVSRTLGAGVGMICVGTDPDSSRKAVELAGKYEGVWASVGLHPNDGLDEPYPTFEYERLARSEGVVAIGEIGLDYYRTGDAAQRAIQMKHFQIQLRLAEELNLPVVIHCREAHDDMLTALSGHQIRGVIHSFNGSPEQARAYLDLGFHIGLNGIITFSRGYEPMVRSLPLDRILLETDAPYLSPGPDRGKRNEPIRVLNLADAVSRIIEEDVNTLIKRIKNTTLSLFNIA